MAKKSRPKYRRDTQPTSAAAEKPVVSGGGMIAARETIESIVIAFVLAFLFRTFEAEAFVIPTGSMSPSLQGQHKDMNCSECGYRFRTTASSEGDERDAMINRLQRGQIPLNERDDVRRGIAGTEVMAGMCPMCRDTVLFRTDGLPASLPGHIETSGVRFQRSYPGDRILVNKYGYGYKDPARWDVVVFKYPGNGEMNYIKRLVGLPNETLKVYQGNIFIRRDDPDADFEIARKPPDKVEAMLQPVHDSNYDPSILYRAGWPLRWSEVDTDAWEIETDASDNVVRQVFRFVANASPAEEVPLAWLRYRHLVPDEEDWAFAREFAKTGNFPPMGREQWQSAIEPELISDFNPYNARVLRDQLQRGGPFKVERHQLGMQWVSDLAVRCELEIERPQGELVLDLVQAGKHFTCHLNLQTGEATLGIEGIDGFEPRATTPMSKAGKYELLFANVDDQLLLWVNGKLISFGEGSGAAEYDADLVFGGRENAIPQTSEDDEGDLSPVGIGARGAALEITRLVVLRDIYYVAANETDRPIPSRWNPHQFYHTDYDNPNDSVQLPDGTRLRPLAKEREIFRNPETWKRFLTRRERPFPIADEQYFVMGDNSPESLDCRLWKQPSQKGVPGGSYVDAQLMTGEAISVFWPHSWGGIPGLDKLPGFPNFRDMRLVR